jgi:hypothetical protein
MKLGHKKGVRYLFKHLQLGKRAIPTLAGETLPPVAQGSRGRYLCQSLASDEAWLPVAQGHWGAYRTHAHRKALGRATLVLEPRGSFDFF